MGDEASVVVHPMIDIPFRVQPATTSTSERRIAHAVAAVLEVTGETAEEVGVRIGLDREVVPAEARLQVPSLADALAWTQLARDGVVVAIGVGDDHPVGNPAEIGDDQYDRLVVDVVA